MIVLVDLLHLYIRIFVHVKSRHRLFEIVQYIQACFEPNITAIALLQVRKALHLDQSSQSSKSFRSSAGRTGIRESSIASGVPLGLLKDIRHQAQLFARSA